MSKYRFISHFPSLASARGIPVSHKEAQHPQKQVELVFFADRNGMHQHFLPPQLTLSPAYYKTDSPNGITTRVYSKLD
jgi:hypothetical protein